MMNTVRWSRSSDVMSAFALRGGERRAVKGILKHAYNVNVHATERRINSVTNSSVKGKIPSKQHFSYVIKPDTLIIAAHLHCLVFTPFCRCLPLKICHNTNLRAATVTT
jgi:hypothetical protein